MKRSGDFPFEKARRISAAEVDAAREAIAAKLGAPRRRRGRPPLAAGERARAVSIRLSPVVLAWARREAKKQGIGYQTFIHVALKQLASRSRLKAPRRARAG